MEQVNKMAFALAELQSNLEVYKGLFQDKEDAEVVFSQFPEIGSALKKSLSVNLIIGCAALFTDPHETSGNENMSFNNLYKRHGDNLSTEAISLRESINQIVENMNLKTFRNKHVGHFGLDEKLGKQSVVGNITTHNLEELMTKGQRLLNMTIRDAQLLPVGHSLAYYSPIPESRSAKRLLDRLRRAKGE
jgi:hypothetical protein